MTTHDAALSPRWARAAARAPGIALRRWLLRAALPLLTIPGLVHAYRVAVWALKTGQGDVFFVIALHAAAIALALLIPGRAPALTTEPGNFRERMLTRYADRADRLNALGRAALLELLVTFAYPPLMTLVAGHPLRWPVYFVVAFVACTVIWPLERLAAVERREAQRLTALDS